MNLASFLLEIVNPKKGRSSLVLLIAVFFSCSGCEQDSSRVDRPIAPKEILNSKFQSILDSSNLKGSVLFYNLRKNQFHSNDFDWAKKGQLPASTYKIPNSIIALESQVVENDSTLFNWDGEKRAFKIWEQDLIFRDAFHYSCVPCYQEVARKVGASKMKQYLRQLDFGKMDVDTSNIDQFWLQGNSRINQYQQIDFLKRFYQSKLPISDRTEKIMKRMVVMDDNDEYKLSGKTGWSISDGINNGWFVGFVESQNKVYFFAANVEPDIGFDMELFPSIRKEVVIEALEVIGVIE